MKKVSCLAFDLDPISKDSIQVLQKKLVDELNIKGISTEHLHITVGYFHNGDLTLDNWQNFVQKYSLKITNITFNRIRLLSNNALVLLPNDKGFEELKNEIEHIFKVKTGQLFNKNRYPHITLWRKTEMNQLLDTTCHTDSFNVNINGLIILSN